MGKISRIGRSLLFRAGILSLSLVIISGCGRREGDKVLATVGGKKITVSDFMKKVKSLPERYQQVVDNRREQFLEDIINDQLLYEEALRKGLDRDRETRELLDEARKKILIASFLEKQVNGKVSVTDEEISVFYQENSDKYMTPEVMRVSHILVPTREEADSIVRELNQGKRFEDVARAKSLDPTAQRGGDVGYFPKGQLMPEFDEACSALQIGEISRPVKTKLGFHVIMLTDRRAPQPMPLERVKEDIRRRIASIKKQELFDETMEKLKAKTRIKINPETLAGLDSLSPEGSSTEPAEQKGGKK